MRLDRALWRDLRTVLGSGVVRLYLLLQVVAAVVFVALRGEDTVSMVALTWLGLLVALVLAWWSGRHRLAQPQPDPVPAARPRSLFALLTAAGMTAWGFGWGAELTLLLVAAGVGGWIWAALRTGSFRGLAARLLRDPRPLLPLLLLLALPKLLAGGPIYLVGALVALPSGIGQELLYLLGLFAPLEAATRRPALAGVVAALVFALIHVPLLLDINGGQVWAATANAVIFQSGVGLVAVVAYRRHRAAVPIGVAHALAMG